MCSILIVDDDVYIGNMLYEVEVGRLFDRLFTVETARNSTGLGLSIARVLTEQMNGTAQAYLKNGKLSVCISFCENNLTKQNE